MPAASDGGRGHLVRSTSDLGAGKQGHLHDLLGSGLGGHVGVADEERAARQDVGRERLWRSVKYEEVYLHACEGVAAARAGLGRSFRFYNAERRHQGLGRRIPDEVYAGSGYGPRQRERQENRRGQSTLVALSNYRGPLPIRAHEHGTGRGNGHDSRFRDERSDSIHPRRQRGRGARGRDDLAGGATSRRRHPPSLLRARARLPGGRQLPRVHGGGRGGAGARRLLPAPGESGAGRAHRDRARHGLAPHGDGATGRRPAAARGCA